MKKIAKIALTGFISILGGLCLMGIVNEKLEIETTITVNKPIDIVFQKFNDSNQMGKWMSGFKSIELVKGQENEIGSQYRMVIVNSGQETELLETLLDYRENELVKLTYTSTDINGKMEIHFREKDNGTTLVLEKHTMQGNSFSMQCFLPFMENMIANQITQDYMAFKKWCEHQN